jgi:RP/EB family microtubule-associated protein
MKRFWDSNYGGQGYDAVGRRRGAPTDTPATMAPVATGRAGGSGTLGIGARSGGKTPVGGHRAGSAQSNEAVQGLQAQLREMSTHLEGLEKERDFYFSKVSGPPFSLIGHGANVAMNCWQLRDIEILAQQQIETLEADGKDDETLREIQKILYSTEVFILPHFCAA